MPALTPPKGPESGAAAPALGVPNQYGEQVELQQLQGGPALVMFYPFAFSRICGGELGELVRSWDRVRRLGAQVAAVSCDSVHTLRAYAEELRSQAAGELEGLHLLSDFWPHGEVCRRYQAFNPDRGAPHRVSVLLDADSTVRHVIVSADDQPRSLSRTLRALGEAAGEQR
ncbi:redoxin domain-containing protein [Nesterenkonia sp.]|uniref:redoxin domain-containing protein n=1 Tax=Nesterenkonia sp. TaxID=704201 RepID=UPI00261737DF|nr:redoxin domain-containing protein [Nesterenkonia sp.]